MRIVKIQEHKSVIDAKSKGKLLNVPDYIRLADIAIGTSNVLSLPFLYLSFHVSCRDQRQSEEVRLC